MDLKQLRIKNIRSFTDEVIEFPGGTTLLSGSIGAGKSTILLAIEFALFGITKEMSGAGLLRNGADKGCVELRFVIDKKEITIKRSLKRGSSVTQEAGYIIIDHAKREATATELRQAILALLQYPPEFLTKSPSTIYRYTVYTPQEEMKSILLGGKDDRLTILRRVFGMDKYKIIKENAELFITNVRIKMREFAAMIVDLEAKKTEEKTIREEITKKEIIIAQVLPQLENLKAAVEEEKKKCALVEEAVKKMQEAKKAREVHEATLNHKINESARLKVRRENLEQAIKELEKEFSKEENLSSQEIGMSIEEREKKIQQQERERREIIRQVQEKKTLMDQSERIQNDLQKLDTCPVCKQKVDGNHKDSVRMGEEKKIDGYKKALEILQQAEAKIEEEIQVQKKEAEEERKKAEKRVISRLKRERYEEKKKELQQIEEEVVMLKREIGVLNGKKNDLEEAAKKSEETEKMYREVKKNIDFLSEQEKRKAIEYATVEKEKENLQNMKQRLANEVEQKERTRERITKLKNLQEWLGSQFIAMVVAMEKQMMLRIHTDFDAFFQKWFEMLVDTEKIRVRIDEEFSPVIEQSGYSIDYQHLSGGEKTAVALAYRLALNQIMNTLMSTIKTRNLLILDEPTDGFSSEQLDRLRTVLEELEAKQIIMVSHESKIESFVQHVLHIEKREHVSAISYG